MKSLSAFLLAASLYVVTDVQAKKGCFNGPMAGKFYAKTSKAKTIKGDRHCQVKKIKSCNWKNEKFGSQWCSMDIDFTNCKTQKISSGTCQKESEKGKCVEKEVSGNLEEIYMYESLYKGRKAEPQPSGFYMKFSNSAWTPLFGSKGTGVAKKWKASTEADSSVAQFFGVTFDVYKGADFLQFHVCDGALGAAPATATPVKALQTGCFNGPMAGKFYPKTSKVQTIRVPSYCKAAEIESCNQSYLKNGPIWCALRVKFTNPTLCPTGEVYSGQCAGGKNVGKCTKSKVDGDLQEIWMYESLYKGRAAEPQPSGFYMKFSNSGWTPIFGEKGTNKPKKWQAGTSVSGGRAQLVGVTLDVKAQADFLQFHMCAGGVTAAPVVKVDPFRNILPPKKFTLQTGCFNGPMAGKFYPKTSRKSTVRSQGNCQVKRIHSCNQKSIANGPIWCWMRTQFTNCPDQIIASGECKGRKNVGKCQSQDVSGDLQEIWMYESLYKGRKAEPQPSGFFMKFSKTGWTKQFGEKGTGVAKKWSSAQVLGGRAQFYGATLDTFKQADFLQFHMCQGGLVAGGFAGKSTAMETIAGKIPTVRQSGCFNAPMAGKFFPATSDSETVRSPQFCKLREITSCNQKKIINGPIWCSLRFRFTNCPDKTVYSGECAGGKNLGDCTTAKVEGDLQEAWMYESLYQGRAGEPVPSGFYLKFSVTGWTTIFGQTGTNSPKKWNAKNVIGGRAQLLGVTYDSKAQADFLQLHLCSGGLTQAPAPVEAKVIIAKQIGCFNGPMAGKFYPKTSVVSTRSAPGYCKLRALTSCNQAKKTNGPIWCYLRASFTNCPDAFVASGECKGGKNLGKCVSAEVSGSIQEIWMYESLYKGKAAEPQPSGFYLKFAQSGWTPLFGETGTNVPKKWNVGNVVGGEAQLLGVTLDTKAQADFLQFRMCAGGLSAEPIRKGCTITTALNYKPLANTEDGSCKFTVFGCMDKKALNFNKLATRDKNLCKYRMGCMDNKALNFDIKAQRDSGKCVLPAVIVPVYGCTQKNALNFNVKANSENGTCKFTVWGCMDKKALNYNKLATSDRKATVCEYKRGIEGCFNGPMGGKFYPKTSKVATFKAKPWCRIVSIESCNQAFTANGPIWCYMKMIFDPRDNCPDQVVTSGECKGAKNIGQCHKEEVAGDLNAIWMYESLYKGRKAEPQPSGFYLKFGNKWTRLFGSTGTKKAKKWNSSVVEGGRAQFYGVTLDTFKQADFLQFHMCSGGLAAEPVIVVPPPATPVDIVIRQSGCFNGPMAGTFHTKTSVVSTVRSNQYCKLREITSCNQKRMTNGPIWCYMRQRFTNCPDSIIHSGECAKGKNTTDCKTSKVDGDIQEIWMYESTYKSIPTQKMPSGFTLKFSRSGWTNLFGSVGDDKVKKWSVRNVVGQRAQMLGVTLDTKAQADFLQFHMCAGGLTQAPSPAPAVIVNSRRQTGCFNGPMAGQFYPKTSRVTTEKVPSYCRVKQMTSCNQKKVSNGPIWCYMKLAFDNCPDFFVASGECSGGKNIGQCTSADVSGSIQDIWMYESLYKGRPQEPQPSGFYLKFSQSGWTPLFGSRGTGTSKKWSVDQVVGGEAQILGITLDTYKQADFLQFHMCAGSLTAAPRPVVFIPPVISGCMDKKARNFNALATKDDGRCSYWILGCTRKTAMNFAPAATRDNGSCKDWVMGCMNKISRNFMATATKDNGSCIFWIDGCMNKLARNHNKLATRDNGSCILWIDGCMNKKARNHNSKATRDNASCIMWVLGCMNKKASNFNALATKDNGSCVMWVRGCMDKKARNYHKKHTQDNGTCKYWVLGCMDKKAHNYNKKAEKDNGSCKYWVLGCMDKKARNFNAKANKDDKSCVFWVLGCMDKKARNHNAKATKDSGKCTFWVLGCMNKKARNHNSKATKDSGKCTFWVRGCMDKKARNYHKKHTQDNGTCKYWVLGCMNKKARNYNSKATKDSGKCTFWVLGCMNKKARNHNSKATKDNGSCVMWIDGCMKKGMMNYNKLATRDNGSCKKRPAIFNTINGCMNKKARNFNAKANRDDGTCVMWVRGCMDKKARNYHKKHTQDNGTCKYWVLGCMNDKARNHNAKANKDDGSCVMWIDGCMDPKYKNFNALATRTSANCVAWIFGCTDKKAHNFNKKAEKDNGSCAFHVEGCRDKKAINYNKLATKDSLKVCRYDDFGCMDSKARNFDKEATKDNGKCVYWVLGCMNSSARNYNKLATKDDSNCVMWVMGCMNSKYKNFNALATKSDGNCVAWIFGCMDKKAHNHNKKAEKDNGSCKYHVMGCMTKSAYNFNPLATKSNASCKYWVMGCINPKATNYNKLATKDNGSCTMPKLIVKPVAAKCWLSALAGCFHPKTSSTRTKEVASTCVLTEIDSCNSPITHSDNWCWMKMSFSNCKSIEFSSGKCKTPTTRGKCNKSRINGNVIRIDLHSDYWKGKKKEAIPAGFTIYTDKNSSARFGTTGKETKTWKGRGRIVGASYDVSGEADFLQFKMCNDDSWWKQPAKTEQVCQSQNIAAKSVVWAADMLGVKCDGSTTAASALYSGAAILLSYSLLF